ncbi:uncharacterized protein LOC124919242 isoform X2 [Impatiens glandulifera]|uniref:uncharacterized protein LOC124919242 isoform X2 n=1 Tax=Impatiens glandulifera TaxID=253017 RepID=UPI001FB11759|nr:uncharacterized protein LOC124919242 isoform X2 [Impatiens glandulifera]
MSAMEKLFVQIFERKNWIFDQLRQQSDLYNQHLASKLLIEGITPPPWLWEPKPLFNLTDPRELNKEEMISELLFPHPNHVFPCSTGLYPLHNKFVVSGENIPLPELLPLQVHAPKKSLGNVQRELGFAPVLDMSPQVKINLSNPDSCMWEDRSLVQVQRSKSRQRALELRSASKRAADKNSTTQETGSGLQEKFSSLKKSTSMEHSGRVTRSRFSREQLNHAEESIQLKDSFKISKKGDNRKVDSTSVCLGKDLFENISSSDLGVNKRRKLRSGACEMSPIVNDSTGNEYQKLSSAQISSNIVDKHDEETQIADFVVYEPCQHQENCGNFELNSTDPVVASENIGLNVPSDFGILAKPKALDSSDFEKNKFIKLSGLFVDKEPLDRLVGGICSSTEKPPESLEITRVDNCDTWHLEGRSLELEVSNKVDEFRESISKTHVEVHAEPGVEKCKSDMKENLTSDFNCISVSVPTMHHLPSDGMESVSTNDGLGKIASPLLVKEKLDTDNRSPEESNFDNPKPLHLSGQPSEPKCRSSGSKVYFKVDDISVSVPNIQHPPSDGIKSLSNNDGFGKIASPLPGKEKLDTEVDKSNILLETDNRSPVQSNFDYPKSLEVPNEVDDMSVSVPNIQQSPSEGIKSMSTNDVLGKIASPLLENEKVDMVVDSSSILLETDNRSPLQSKFDNSKTLDLWGQSSELNCQSSGSKVPNEVDGMSVSVPNIQHSPSEGMKSVSTNDVLFKIASPLLEKEKVDMVVDRSNILLETDNRSPLQSKFDNPKTLDLWGKSSELNCQSSGSKVPNEVGGMSVSVPNIQYSPSEWIKSVSTNDVWGKVASPLLEKEKVDMVVNRSSILLETDNISPEQSDFDNPKTLHLRGKLSEPKCQSSGSKVPNEVDEFQQGFSNIHVKVFARPYMEDCESDKNTPESNIVDISATDRRIQYYPDSCGEKNMVIDDGPHSEMPQSLKKHLTEGYNSSSNVQSDEGENANYRKDKKRIFSLTFQETENSSSLSSLIIQPTGDHNNLCEELGLEASNGNTFNYKGGCAEYKQILSPEQDDLNKRMRDPISTEIIMQENFNLPESGTLDCGLVNGKDGYLGPSSSQVEEFDKSCSQRGVMFTNNSYPQLKRRKFEGEKKRPLSASTIVLGEKSQNVTQHPVNVETSLEVSSQCQSLHVSHDSETTHIEIDANPEVEMHHKLLCHLTAGSELPPVLQDEIDTKEGDTDTDSSSIIRMDFLGDSILNKQSYSDSKGAAFSYMEFEDPASIVFDELEDPQAEYGLQPSSSSAYTNKKDPESVGADCISPEFEGFTSFDDVDFQNKTIEQVSYLKQLSIYSSMCTPVPQSSTAFMLPESLYKSVPNGLLEQINFGNSHFEIDDISKQNRASHSCTQEGKHKNQESAFSHCLLFSDSQFGWSSKRSCLPSSVGNVRDHMDLIPSKSSSSEKHRSLNPELTCFRIEEDPGDYSEESENADGIPKEVEEKSIFELVHCGDIREALAEIAESQINDSEQITAANDRCHDRNSLCTEPSFTGNKKMVRQNPANRYSKRHPSEGKENFTLSVEVNRKKRAESSNNRFSKLQLSSKGSERQGRHRPSEKQSKHKNIVSNITSFVPFVQQKQAAAVCTGKRDIKVRALETAEAAKRLEEKRNNERIMKKEALKLERERLARENLKQTELLKKKKEEELKKKDADIAARKRLREDEEKRAKERKRKRVEHARQQLDEQEGKLHARKGEKEIRPTTTVGKMNSRESNDRLHEQQKMEKGRVDDKALCKTIDARGVMGDSVRDTRSYMKSPEKSYDISPYQNSENEDDDEDVAPMMKFIPPWARKNSQDIASFLQDKMDPDVIFPPESFPTTVNLGKWPSFDF